MAETHPPQSTVGGAASVTLPSDDETLSDALDERPERSAAELPEAIGRHRVRAILGMGGMGVVYEAFDPELDRKIAIKLVRLVSDDGSNSGSERAHARMKREAQAMARLNHRNVITVYDVGEHDGGLYIAMELVEGESLARWCRRRPPPGWREVLDAYEQAATGLATAHRAGLVHRDFKPENAMMGTDGVVRVLDFGLAQPSGESVPSLAEGGESLQSLRSSRVTRTGALVGTPAFMAPEQLDGSAADARSDQFSFCVALWEALYEQRPFQGDDLAALVYSITSGELRKPVASRGVPGWLRRVLVRGLAKSPEQRWPDMDALLAELRRGRGRRRRGLIVAGIAASSVTLVAGAAFVATRDSTCSGGAEALAGVWDDARREAVRAAMVDTGLGYAASTFERLQSRLDQYAARWVAAHEEACVATRVREERSEAVLDREMACLYERRARLLAFVDVLTQAKSGSVEAAVGTAAGLPPPERCTDLQAIERGPALPEDAAAVEVVAGQRAELARAKALADGGRIDEAREVALAVSGRSEAIGFEPLVAEAAARLAAVYERAGDYPGSEREFTRAYNLALAIGHDEIAHDAASGLMFVAGVKTGRFDDAHRWADASRALLRRANLGPVAEATLDVNVAGIALDEGKLDVAESTARAALAAMQAELEEDDPRLIDACSTLAMALARRHELDESRTLFEQALELAEAYGEGHPEVARALVNLAVVQQQMGEHDAARASLERALPILEAAYGTEHPMVASLLNNLGGLHYEIRDFEAARDFHQRALDVRVRLFGEEHATVAQSYHNLANAHAGLDQEERAAELMRKSLTIRERTLGPDHPVIASTLTNLSNSLVRLGRPAEALPLLDRAIAILERVHGPDHIGLAFSLTARGEVLVALDRHADAIDPLERALRLREREPHVDGKLMGATRFVLAQALRATGGDRKRAALLARQALADMQRSAATNAEDLERLHAWLADNG
jgi:tetratricopeptide (TPR) repeat protein